MTNKEFEVAKQVEIDGKSYHESAQVSFGFKKETKVEDVGGNKVTTRTYKLMKYIVVRDKVREEIVVREEEGSPGKVTILNQMALEIQKEMKRIENLKGEE